MKQFIIIITLIVLCSYTAFSQACATISNGRINVVQTDKDKVKEDNIDRMRALYFPPGFYGKVTLQVNNNIRELDLEGPNIDHMYMFELDKNKAVNKLNIKMEGSNGCLIVDLLTDYERIEFSKQDNWTITYRDRVKNKN